MKRLDRLFISLAILPFLLFGAVLSQAVAQPAHAAVDSQQKLCEGTGGSWTGGSCVNAANEGRTVPQFIESVVNILLLLVGAVSVVMIVIGGIKYTTSGGDQKAIQSAKDTILYAIIGIVVAFLAYAAVKFVIAQF